MATTARRHFDDDIGRAKNKKTHADTLAANGGDTRLVNDIRLSAVAMSVGAMDAYLCDAYVECLTAVLKAYTQGTWSGRLPAAYAKQLLPAGEVLDSSRQQRPLWSIRMAARKIMERDNMLSIAQLPDEFNPILPPHKKIWADFIGTLLAHDRRRLTRHTSAEISALNGKAKENAIRQAVHAVKKRVAAIVQIRHDWIHNCARPKAAIQDLSAGQANTYIRDIETFVTDLDDHIQTHRLV